MQEKIAVEPKLPDGHAQDGTRPRQRSGSVASTGDEPLVKRAVCKGSYLQRTACKACLRCAQEKSMLLRNYRLGFWTFAEIESFDLDPHEADEYARSKL